MDNLFHARALVLAIQVRDLLRGLPLEEKVDALNEVRTIIAEASPFQGEPVDLVLWQQAEIVRGNDYNPNAVAPPEMRLLEQSIVQDGMTQPVVGYPEADGTTVVDGFHRTRVCKESRVVRERLHGYLPLVHVRGERGDLKARMAATIRHNRARGVHGVIPMMNIVAAMLREGMTDEETRQELGMDADEILRFRQVNGLPELFKDRPYSRAWIGASDAEGRKTRGGRPKAGLEEQDEDAPEGE